jgi:spore coat protein CotF
MNFSQVSGNQPSSNLQERDLMNDVLSSQKFITDTYNTFTNECATPNVRDGFMSLLNEEHQIQAEVFDMMKQRGWYQTPAADQQKVNQAKQQYASQKAQS